MEAINNIKKITKVKNRQTRKAGSIRVRLIIIPLVLVMLMIAGIAFISSYNMRKSLISEMKNNGLSISEKLISHMEDNAIAMETINGIVEDKIRITANTIIREKDNLSNDYLRKICEDSAVAQINWYNPMGVIKYSNFDGYIDWAATEGHPVHDFMIGSSDELMESIRMDTESGDYLKYGYIKNNDGTFMQIGIDANRVQELTDEFSYNNLLKEITQNEEITYAFIVDKNLEAIAFSNDNKLDVVFNDERSASAITSKEVYQRESTYKEAKLHIYDVMVPITINGEYIGSIVLGYSMENIEGTINQNIKNVVITGLIAFLLLSIALFSTANGAIKTINRLKKQVGLMASGDFTDINLQDISSQNNEFGQMTQAVYTMHQSIRDMITNILNESTHLAASAEELNSICEQSSSSAEEVAKTIEEIAKGASSQAKETEQGSLSIIEMGELITENKEDINTLNCSTELVNTLKDEGIVLIKELIATTEINNKSTKDVQVVISNTNESAAKIVGASEMIKGIANQTNLLALNASIEAARAGESGKGFAVVADEIRKLAEASNKFTGQISTIVTELTEQTLNAVNTMKELEKVVAAQSLAVSKTSDKFDGISDAIEEIKKVIDKVNYSSNRMTGKKDEIIDIIENLSAISEENAAATEETTASMQEQTAAIMETANSSEELARIAETLNKQIEKFTI